ncbi:exostosin family-domain-containing protein [Zopfochytrium polystomum]|nr:exostosin family-domain-containing protein [Zopfochytrium polystomum]
MYYGEVLIPDLVTRAAAATLRPAVATQDPAKADWFLVPHYSTCFYHACVFSQDPRPPEDCKLATGDYLAAILAHVRNDYRHWNASHGTDHVFVFSWDQGSEVLGWHHPVRTAVRNASHVTLVGSRDRTDAFDPLRDVVVPPYADLRAPRALAALPFPVVVVPTPPAAAAAAARLLLPSPRRPTHAYFRGTILPSPRYSRGARQYLRELARAHPPPRYAVHTSHAPRDRYWAELANATFALCPSGWSAWSPRLVDAVAVGAVPVVIARGIRLPFEEVVRWDRFAVVMDEEEVSKVDAVLAGVGDAEIWERRRVMMREVRYMLMWNDPPVPGDAFYQTVRELEKLSAKRRAKG